MKICQMLNVKCQMLWLFSAILFFAASPIFFGSYALAQFELPSLSLENFSLQISPELPLAGEQVQATLNSISFDINSVNITWIHNGKTVLKGVGEKIYRFNAGGVGKEEIIKAIVVSPSGASLSRTSSIIVADLDLLWQAKTTAPAPYQGKALPILRSAVKITALPNFVFQGKRLSSSSLIYKWYLGDELFQESSGAGKQNFEFKIPITAFQSQKVKVEVSSPKGSIKARKTIAIPIVEPKVFIYEENPSQGLKFNKALREANVSPPGKFDFRAGPYYFSGLNPLVYNWSANGSETEKKKPFNLLSLNIGEGFFGGILVNLRIENLNNPLETAETNLKVNAE